MTPAAQPEFPDFYLPFGGKLDPGNRWVALTSFVPWDLVEKLYGRAFTHTGMGPPPLPGRVAFGALIIKERLGVTDEETVAQVRENPYLQYFLGYHEMLEEAPFDPSMMVHFRKRFDQSAHDEINAETIRMAAEAEAEKGDGDGDGAGAPPPTNKGKLLIDASATPADITYPTDLKLLNTARQKLEHIIDELHRPHIGTRSKPRTHRNRARRDYLNLTKLKKPRRQKLHKALGKQLRYIRRNLRHIKELLATGSQLSHLPTNHYRNLLVATEIYRQQHHMWKEKTHSTPHRIVSLSQPWIRPNIRGKAAAKTEFGAKISIRVNENGYTTLHQMSWDAYNESTDLPSQAETYRKAHGSYPESIHADKIYRTRANRAWCKKNGIRISGPPLGRPRKETTNNAAELAALKKQTKEDEAIRNGVEGKLGNAKRKGTLSRVMAKLKETSLTTVNIAILVLNLDTRLRAALLCVLEELLRGWLRSVKRYTVQLEEISMRPLPPSRQPKGQLAT